MRRIQKRLSSAVSQTRRRARIHREAYADLRHLVSLEPLAKKIKLPFIPRNGETAVAPEGRPASRNLLLIIDQRLSMYYGSKQKMKSVVAAEIAALLAWHAFARKDRLGAIIFGDWDALMLSPNHSRIQVMLIFHDLVNQNHRLSTNPDQRSNPGMLNDALRRAAAATQENFQIVLITDGSGQDQETGRLLQNISAQNDVAVILVYDPRQVGCPGSDRFNAGDRAGFQPTSNRSCFFADEALTVPVSNHVDAIGQFRRGIRKLLRLRRNRSKQTIQPSLPAGPQSSDIGAVIAKNNGVEESALSLLPSPAGTQQPLRARFNSQ